VHDALLADVRGELVGLDVAQEVDGALAMEREYEIVEGLAVERGDLAAQLRDRDQPALGDVPLACFAYETLELFVIQPPLSVGQRPPLADAARVRGNSA
jgi:hypothetical protein